MKFKKHDESPGSCTVASQYNKAVDRIEELEAVILQIHRDTLKGSPETALDRVVETVWRAKQEIN